MPAPTNPDKYSKWDGLGDDDDDPIPESRQDPAAHRRWVESNNRTAPASGAASAKKAPTSATAEWDAAQKKSKGEKPTNIKSKSSYIASFAGESGRLILLRLQHRYSPVMGPASTHATQNHHDSFGVQGCF